MSFNFLPSAETTVTLSSMKGGFAFAFRPRNATSMVQCRGELPAHVGRVPLLAAVSFHRGEPLFAQSNAEVEIELGRGRLEGERRGFQRVESIVRLEVLPNDAKKALHGIFVITMLGKLVVQLSRAAEELLLG